MKIDFKGRRGIDLISIERIKLFKQDVRDSDQLHYEFLAEDSDEDEDEDDYETKDNEIDDREAETPSPPNDESRNAEDQTHL